MDAAEHGTDAAEMEDFFDLQTVLPILSPSTVPYDNSTMEVVTRDRGKWKDRVNPCRFKSSFHIDTRLPACRSAAEVGGDRVAVFTSDNCWDMFYCELTQRPGPIKSVWLGRVAPLLQSAIRNSVAPSNVRPGAGRVTVVAHVRRGDHGKSHSPGTYFRALLDGLLSAARRPVEVIVHTNGLGEKVLQEIGIESTGNVVVRVFGKDSDATLQTTLLDMIDADVFLASKSGLSVLAGLYRTRDPSTILYPEQIARRGLTGLGWNMIQESLGIVRHLDLRTGRWEDAKEDFWASLLDRTVVG